MTIALVVLLIISSLGLIATVLMQSGRAAGLSGAISGAGESLFGKKKGLDDFFSKLSTVFAVIFLLTNLVMAIFNK